MSKHAAKALLVGRRIVGFESNSFPNGRGGTAHNPVITLDNGARLTFITEETDGPEYGVSCIYHPKPSNREPCHDEVHQHNRPPEPGRAGRPATGEQGDGGEDVRTYRILDGSDSDVLGGAVSEDNVYISTYAAVLKDYPAIDALAVGESTFARYNQSGQKPAVYRIIRES